MGSRIIRFVGIFSTILGFYLLFAPVIAILKFIPLVGWLLASIVSIAALLFALVVGTVLACLTIGVSWLVYRPLIGLSLLAVVGTGIYFIFFFGKGVDPSKLEEETSAA